MAVCDDIREELDVLLTERASIQEELRTGKTSDPENFPARSKPVLTSIIRGLNVQIEEKERELAECLNKSGVAPAKITSRFVGTMSLFTIPTSPLGFGGPAPIQGSFTFSGPNFTTVLVNLNVVSMPWVVGASAGFSGLPLIVFTCPGTVSIGQNGIAHGTFDTSTGNLTCPGSFTVQPSVSNNGIFDPCFWANMLVSPTMSFVSSLTTMALPSPVTGTTLSGAPLNRSNRTLMLLAAGPLTTTGLPLFGPALDMEIRGTLTPIPP
jgi:hypothetical protein